MFLRWNVTTGWGTQEETACDGSLGRGCYFKWGSEGLKHHSWSVTSLEFLLPPPLLLVILIVQRGFIVLFPYMHIMFLIIFIPSVTLSYLLKFHSQKEHQDLNCWWWSPKVGCLGAEQNTSHWFTEVVLGSRRDWGLLLENTWQLFMASGSFCVSKSPLMEAQPFLDIYKINISS
jgi:hypothetical protein